MSEGYWNSATKTKDTLQRGTSTMRTSDETDHLYIDVVERIRIKKVLKRGIRTWMLEKSEI